MLHQVGVSFDLFLAVFLQRDLQRFEGPNRAIKSNARVDFEDRIFEHELAQDIIHSGWLER